MDFKPENCIQYLEGSTQLSFSSFHREVAQEQEQEKEDKCDKQNQIWQFHRCEWHDDWGL
jgi:hypothetical protein